MLSLARLAADRLLACTRPVLSSLGLQVLFKAGRFEELRHALSRAELEGDLPEFQALSFHAVLAMADGSEHARDYLEMAEAAASSRYELALIAETLATYDLLRAAPLAAAERCVKMLDLGYQTEGLWISLVVALACLGRGEAIDATLESFARLDPRDTARLVRLLSSEPGLREVRNRPACRPLLAWRGAK
jgi:hypothetical protein